MSLSLVAVFIPILLMGGIVGRLFREFAVTLSIAILISLVVSLTTTPMMCAYLLRPHRRERPRPARIAPSERVFDALLRCLRPHASAWALRHGRLSMLVHPARRSRLNVYLFIIDPEGLLPAAGHRPASIGGIQADQSISFQAMQQKLRQFVDIVRAGSGGRQRRRLHRRRPDQFRLHVRRAEAAGRAQGSRPTR